MKFTENDIKDKSYLEEKIEEESQRIFNSSRARKGRSIEEIRRVVRQGKVAEVFLIETGQYKESDIMYHDLIDNDGDYVEVKAYSVTSSNSPYVQKDLFRLKFQGWNKSKWYMLFNYDQGTYTFLEKIKIRETS